ncbi:MAG: DUF4330 domain-containing protein [Ruminococcaceae bacterium]|nr:DUF4330 domain-containing protein [Oscillospiraceae bacterium]
MNEINNSTQQIKKRSRKKFNLIDFLLIVVVLLITAGLVYLFLPTSLVKNITADRTVQIRYVLEVKGVDGQYINNIAAAQLVQDSVSKGEIGYVEAVENNPYSELRYDLQQETDSGIGVISQIDGKYDLRITITADARYEEGAGYTVNGTRIAVGEKIYTKFPDFACEAFCIGVEEQ